MSSFDVQRLQSACSSKKVLFGYLPFICIHFFRYDLFHYVVYVRGTVAQSVERPSMALSCNGSRPGATQRSTDVGSIPERDFLYTQRHK